MAVISSPIETIKSHYDIVIIGSGYGGAIAASRLSRAGKNVCLLERGNEIIPGQYPNTAAKAIEHIQIHSLKDNIGSPTAMIDLRVHEGMNVLIGCGLGGTSLINANVALKPDPRLFDDPAWPEIFKQEYHDPASLLQKGYLLATEMLKPSPLPDHIHLDKIDSLKKSADAHHQKFYRTDINVNFDVDGPNHVGVLQKPCNLCGDCCSGCNNHAKNTLLMNYLPDAKNHGAEIFTRAIVREIERKNNRWLVHFTIAGSGDNKFGSQGSFVEADLVILSAGTLGSNEILLRSKAKGLKVSDKLGNHFSGNGDVIGFAYNTTQQINGVGYGTKVPPPSPHTAGPCITSVIDIRDTSNVYDGMIIEDAVGPGAISHVLPDILAGADIFEGKDEVSNDNLLKRLSRWYKSTLSVLFGSYVGAVKNTQTYLVMAHDKSAGKFLLKNDRLDIEYDNVGNEPIFEKIDQTLQQATKTLDGVYVKNPIWSKLMHHDLITVHPLGGCALADTFINGVVNHKGQVFSGESDTSVYEDLYITDGSVIPRSLGVNPLFTISAVSERCIALLAQDRGWYIDYTLPFRKEQPKPSDTIGIEFTEKMQGYFTFGISSDDYQAGYDLGKASDNSISFILTIRSEDADALIGNPDHIAHMTGSVMAPSLSPEPIAATEGIFNLFIYNPEEVNSKTMNYRMKLVTEENKHYYFKGYKIIRPHSIFNMWYDTSTLFTTLYEGDDDQGKIIGQGILVIKPSDFITQLGTIKAVNSPSLLQSIKTESKFGAYFAKSLFYEYGGIFIPNKYYDPSFQRIRRPLRLCAPEFYPFKTDDNIDLLLTRYNGQQAGESSENYKKPLLMVHGFSGNRLTFSIDTIDTNMAEYFYEQGYDVWLFDYRLSNLLPSARQPQILDTIAKYDYPGAIKVIQQATGENEIDVIAHCVGSITLFMAMMSGLKGVRSIVSAQIASDFVAAPQPRWKCGLHGPQLLQDLGVHSLTAYADTHSDWENRLYDKFLKLYAEPLAGVCNSPSCHRLTLMFGPLYEHSKLNDATHTAQVEMFQMANLRTYEQLTLMINSGHLVDADDKDIYRQGFDNLDLPITFVHGEFNAVFNPESTLKTYDQLVNTFGNKNYQRHVIPDYGHNDCMYGKEADKDVFPLILKHLHQFKN